MKSTIIEMLLICTFALSYLCPLAVADSVQTLILKKPVKVTVKDIDGSEENHYQLELSVEYRGTRFKFYTNMIHTTTFKEAIESQRISTRWKGSYLLIGWERGGGNASRGYLDTVFMLKKGKLIYLGEVDADSFENGIFKDWYDRFELNELTSHAESPVVRIVLEEKDGRLEVNLEKTWNENQKRFDDNKKIIKNIQAKEKMNSESRASQITGPLLFNAVLGKYCKHEKDIKNFNEISKKELDQERLKLFDALLARVKPGELPKARVELQKY